MRMITINGICIDLSSAQSPWAAETMDAPSAPQSSYILVQTHGALNEEEKSELANLGVSILAYVPDDTYEAHYNGMDLHTIQELPCVAWVGAYPPGCKLSPNLISQPSDSDVRSYSEVACYPERSFLDPSKTVDVVFHSGVNSANLRDKIAAAAGLDPDDLELWDHKARITIQLRRLNDLAAIDEVRHIEEVPPLKLLNNEARKIIGIEHNNSQLPFEGEGQLVAIADTGFDIGELGNVHPAFAGRVVKLYDLGRPGRTNDPNGHGTHVAGSVLGDANSQQFGPVRGIAPRAKLILQSIMDARGRLEGGVPDDLRRLFAEPYETDGVRIHSNSWGNEPGDSRYDMMAWETDDFVWNHRDCVICFAAGNDASDVLGNGVIGLQSITSPGTAKNCITVGATENQRPDFELTYGNGWPGRFPVPPIAGDKVADDAQSLAAFSSRGPTQDQRIKPDVVAPGTAVLSTLSRAVLAANPGLGLHDRFLFFDAGTSMATPLVAGCVTIAREFLAKEHLITNPSAALLKALMINCARSIAGQNNGSGGIPNNDEGFGLVDMTNLIAPASASASLRLLDEGTALDKKGATEQTTITINAQTSLIKVTLVWTDPPGCGLQNDLDLIVKAHNGEERHGNMPPASTQFDRVNNVEQVTWENPPIGDLEITVRAHRISLFPQPYVLVIRTA